MTQIYRGSMPRVQLLSDNNPKPPYLLSQKEPAFLRPDCALWRPGRAVKPIAIWEMCNRLAWKTSGMLALDGQAELTSEVFTHFKDVPVFSLVCCPWAWMGVWRMHPQTRKTSKETHEHWDCVQRQQEQTLFCSHWASTDRKELVGVCVFTLLTHVYALCHKKAAFGLCIFVPAANHSQKEEVLMMFMAHFCNTFYP